MVRADADGEVCFWSNRSVSMIVDINGVSGPGIVSFPNRRVDTRVRSVSKLGAGEVLRVVVPEAVGGKTVVGQLTVDRATETGFVTAYGCDDVPAGGASLARSDAVFVGAVSPVASNRLVVRADADGEVCFWSNRSVSMIVAINGVSGPGIVSFPNRRVDTRVDDVSDAVAPVDGSERQSGQPSNRSGGLWAWPPLPDFPHRLTSPSGRSWP